VKKSILLAGAAAIALAATAAHAQEAAPMASASATETASGVIVYQPDFFAQARPNTALEMVQRVPGFGIVDGDGSRGFEGAVGNVLINGARPASKTDTGSSVLSRTPASQVERIELVRGGAPGIDMQGFPLVVNVILKSQATIQHVVNANAFFFEGGGEDLYGGSYQVTARDGDTNWSLTLSDGVSMSDSFGPGTVTRTNGAGVITRAETVDGYAKGGGQSARATWAGPFAGGKIDLTGRYGVNDWFQESVQESATALRTNRNVNDGDGGEVGAVYERPLSPALKFEGRLIHQFSSSEGAASGDARLAGVDQPQQVFSYANDASETIIRGQLRHENGAVTTEVGAEAAYNALDTRQAFTVGGVPVPLPSDQVKVEETRMEAFARSTWRMTETLTLETGLRLESSTISQSGDSDAEKDLFYAKPRAQLTWTPGQGNQLRFRVERDVGQLDFGDFAASADLQADQVFGGNADLEPDQRWIFEAAYERRFWGDGVVSLTLRHDEISDVIDRIPLVGGFSAVGNIGDGTYDSARLSLTLPTDRLGISGGRLRTSGTWQESSVTDPTTGRQREISGIRPFDANIAFTQDIQSIKTQWGFEWLRGFDEALYDPDSRTDVRLRNYRILFVEWKPTTDLSIRGQVNIWDDFTVSRTQYANRTTQAIDYVEVRDVDPRTFFQVRVRKTF
jgi:outer membrane receptor for ferrienterochelin and colicin